MNMTSQPDFSREDEITRKIENYKRRRKRLIATILLSMFGIYLLPFRNFILVLAIIAFGIAPGTIIYYTWKKHQLEKELNQLKPDSEQRHDDSEEYLD